MKDGHSSGKTYRESDGLEIVPRCPVCSHEARDGIETVAALGCIVTWGVAAKRVNATFGTDFKAETLKRHMTRHPLHREVAEQDVIMESMRGENGAKSVSMQRLLDTLLMQGALDVSKGWIKPTSVSELMQVMQMSMNVAEREDRRKAAETIDPSDFYAVISAWGEAMQSTLTPNQLALVAAKASALGAHLDITRMSVERTDRVDVDAVMEDAVEDYRRRGLLPTDPSSPESVVEGVELPS